VIGERDGIGEDWTNKYFKAYEIKWSKSKRAVGAAFVNRYHIPVEVISKENVTDFLL